MVSKGRSGQANASEPADRNKRPFDLARRWNVARFLFCGGTLLVTLGLAGVLGLLSSLSHDPVQSTALDQLVSSLVRRGGIGSRNDWRQEASAGPCGPCSNRRHNARCGGLRTGPECCPSSRDGTIDRSLGSYRASRRRHVGDLGAAQQ